jgi:hypothetical protein
MDGDNTDPVPSQMPKEYTLTELERSKIGSLEDVSKAVIGGKD